MGNNRLISILILIGAAGGVLFWIVWGIVLNKGTVVFNYDRPPYTVTVSEETKTCLKSECEFWIPVGPRSFTITKEGYYEQTGSVNIVRDKKITQEVYLEFIPQSAQGTEFKTYLLPAGYSKFLETLKDISLFAEYPESLELKGLPKILNNIIFSSSGQKAVVFEENKVSVYSAKDFSLKKYDEIKDAVSAVFSNDESVLYAVAYDESAKKYALKKIYLNEDLPAESLIFFGRDVKNYELKLSDSAGLVALADKTFSPEKLYIIDLNNKTRTNIFEGYLIKTGGWSQNGEVFVFDAKPLDKNFSSVYFYKNSDKSVEKLNAQIKLNNLSFLNGEAVFVTDQNYSITNSSVPYSVKFENNAVPTTIQELTQANGSSGPMIFARWNIADGSFYMIKDLSGIINGVPQKIELSPDGKTVRMLIDGKVFDIKIRE